MKKDLKFVQSFKKMEELAGISIEDFDFNPQKMGDLLYHEGPLLAHFVDKNNLNEHYLYKWTDANETCNRWLVFKVSVENLKSFFQKEISLLQLIKKDPFVYFLDLDNNLVKNQIMLCSSANIPRDYLPSSASFFLESQYENYALELKKNIDEETLNGRDEIWVWLVQEIKAIKEQLSETNAKLTALQMLRHR